jgi:thymidylate synthase
MLLAWLTPQRREGQDVTTFTHENGSELYLELTDYLLGMGSSVTARGLPTKELRGITAVITNPDQVHVLQTARKPSLKIAATEAMHLVGGISHLGQLDLASGGRFSKFADLGRLRGAYGPRTALQLLMAERLIRDDSGTRQAGVTIWNGNETAISSKDVPCTTHLHFYLRDGLLELDVTMRSNDILLGFPIDIMMFSCLQRSMAASLGVEPGTYRHHAGSLHAYEHDLGRLNVIMEAGITEQQGMPIPLPVPYFSIGTFHDMSFSLMAAKAREICLRESDDGFNDREWLIQRVPLLGPGWDWCPLCRYVIRPEEGCTECFKPKGRQPAVNLAGNADPEKLRPFTGRYVAVRDGEVISNAADILGVITDLRSRGEMAHAVFRVPA